MTETLIDLKEAIEWCNQVSNQKPSRVAAGIAKAAEGIQLKLQRILVSLGDAAIRKDVFKNPDILDTSDRHAQSSNTFQTLIDKLEFEVWHTAQDSEFDTGFNLAKEMAIAVVKRHPVGEIIAAEQKAYKGGFIDGKASVSPSEITVNGMPAKDIIEMQLMFRCMSGKPFSAWWEEVFNKGVKEAIAAMKREAQPAGETSGNETFDDFHRRIFKRDPSLSLSDDGGYNYHGDSSTAYRVWFALENAPKRESGWLPIETAPKGEEVWVFENGVQFCAKFMDYDMSDVTYKIRPANKYKGWIDGHSDACSPTHWREKPTDPTKIEGGQS